MPGYTEKIESISLNTVWLKGIVAFPELPLSFEITDKNQIELCREASKDGGKLLLISVKNITNETPEPDDLYSVGVVAVIRQFLLLPGNTARVMAEGQTRAEVLRFEKNGDNIRADVLARSYFQAEDNVTVRGKALMLQVNESVERLLEFVPKPSPELIAALKSIRIPGLLADFVASNMLVNHEDKQEVLEVFEPVKRLEKLALVIEKELTILEEERRISKKIRDRLESNQRQMYLQHQLNVIREELGEDDYGDDEVTEYAEKVEKADLPDEVREKLRKEVKRLSKIPGMSPESGVIKTYLDTCLDIPWNKTTKDRLNISTASKILERDHDGLDKVKQRILEFLAVKQLNPEIKNQILCLVGPPGTGKTSIAASIAGAINRKYVRVSLGGVRDEAEIRGHRKTYVGAMPGRIIEALIKCKTRNPVMLLDEVDKLTSNMQGDPSSALLEVLDSEQNKAFRDHYVELPVDLSEVLFICTANYLHNVPKPLVDRMEVIELKIYSRTEKLSIARDHLIPKQLKRHGLTKRQLKIDDSAVYELIDYYTSEAGVRNLEREIGSLCRKAAKKIIEEGVKSVKISEKNIIDFLGSRKVKPKKIAEADRIGVVNGLAWTEIGGDLLEVECITMPGSGKCELTGQLGDVMKESAHLAISYIRANSEKLGIDTDFYKTKDIHIHVPEGAVPKDGPSAGVTITTALASELMRVPVRRDVAMTGEIDLRGEVLAIGGLKEKTMAAYKAGIKTVLLPKSNSDDLEEIDQLVRENLKFVECTSMQQVLDAALVKSTAESTAALTE
ncbi:MAG TPA: endopeptidase La [Clostridiales bacterium]|nr:endopeptidase La [Clostridiales bacterium]